MDRRPGGASGGHPTCAYLILLPLLTIVTCSTSPLQGSLILFLDYRSWRLADRLARQLRAVLFDAEWWNAVWNSVRYSLLVISLTFLPRWSWPSCACESAARQIVFRTLFYCRRDHGSGDHPALEVLLRAVGARPAQRRAAAHPAAGFLLVGAGCSTSPSPSFAACSTTGCSWRGLFLPGAVLFGACYACPPILGLPASRCGTACG